MKRIAVIDIGTNSVLYLLAEEKDNHRIQSIYQDAHTSRLGKGLNSSGLIVEGTLNSTLTILKRFKELARSHHADSIMFVGTHALRTASNREEVCEIIRQETGMTVEILPEEQEAFWSFRGAVYGRSLSGIVLVCDVGGGSTEFILGDKDRISLSQSLPLGAVTLTEKWLQEDPPKPEVWQSMGDEIALLLQNKVSPILKNAKHFICVGGTITTAAALLLNLQKYNPDQIDGFPISREDLKQLTGHLIKIPLIERKQFVIIDTERADILPAGCRIVLGIMALGGFKSVRVSDRGLRFGIALREFKI